MKETFSRPDVPSKRWRARLHEIIFESDTVEGRAFDGTLTFLIIASVTAVILESVPSIQFLYGDILIRLEWWFTILFTIEYIIRLIAVRHPARYAKSFFGVIDLLSVLPTYLSLFIPGAQAFLVIRAFRILRMFRIFKMARYVKEADFLMTAVRHSHPKITVFIFCIIAIVIMSGTLMHLIESGNEGFYTIPSSIYWAVVTLTTVGYGDIIPSTVLGKFVASCLMILGYGVIAVPTGIVSAELTRATRHKPNSQACLSCGQAGHDPDASFCKFCGGQIK
jgi:voltage-gated potassium channel